MSEFCANSGLLPRAALYIVVNSEPTDIRGQIASARARMILVVGATGTLGRKVTRILLASGEKVRAMTRLVSRADEVSALGARVIRGDLRDRESLNFALNGVSTVVAAAHSILGKGEDASEEVDDNGHRALIEAAKSAGVEHFIYTSVAAASPDHPVDFWRTKARIEQYLKNGSLPYTIVRPTAFMEVHAYQFLGKAVLDGNRVVLIGRGTNPRNFVAAEDVAKVIAGSVKMPGLRGETIEVGGPENLSAHDVIEIFERVSGEKAKVTHVPIAAVRTMSFVMRRIHPGIARIMKQAVVAETTDQRFDPSVLRSKIPITLTRLEDWLRSRIAGE